MATPNRFRSWRWACLPFGALLGAAVADPGDPYPRLRSMPREARLELAENLKRFDALPPDERARLRDLDRQLQALEPDERARYLAVLRRYHLLLRRLGPDQAEALAKANDPRERLELVARFLKAERDADPEQAPTAAGPEAVGPLLPLESAYMIRVWLTLPPNQKARFAKVLQPVALRNQLLVWGRTAGIQNPHQVGPQDRIYADQEVKRRQQQNPQAVKAHPARLHRALVEQSYLRRLQAAYRWGSVDPATLLKFDAALPPPLHESFDALPPEEARSRLTLLYHLVAPRPEQLEPPAAQRKGTVPSAGGGAPRTHPPTGPSSAANPL